MADVRNIEGLRWLAEVQQSHAAQWALGEIERLEKEIESAAEAEYFAERNRSAYE